MSTQIQLKLMFVQYKNCYHFINIIENPWLFMPQ